MIKFIRSLFPKDESSPAFRREMAERIRNKALRYVSERDENDEDIIVGRSGHITINKYEECVVTCGIETIFRVDVLGMTAAHLMSNDGVILEGLDKETGRQRKIICYYVYYRK